MAGHADCPCRPPRNFSTQVRDLTQDNQQILSGDLLPHVDREPAAAGGKVSTRRHVPWGDNSATLHSCTGSLPGRSFSKLRSLISYLRMEHQAAGRDRLFPVAENSQPNGENFSSARRFRCKKLSFLLAIDLRGTANRVAVELETVTRFLQHRQEAFDRPQVRTFDQILLE